MIFLAAFFFDDIERWQLWFDNPNKASVFLAELVIAGVWLMLNHRRLLAWFGYVLTTGAALVLLHTLSRGGLLACGTGLVFVSRRVGVDLKWKKKAWLLALLLVILSLFAFHLKVQRRCLHGIIDEDASIQNRLVLWSAAPDMFRAAPWGWGVGKSGDAYQKWFQPPDRQERYRTLVSSHLTTLVELGWGFGLLYLYTWFSAFVVGVKFRRFDRGLCLGELTCLFVGGIFSSVFESLWLWVLPVSVFLISVRKMMSGGLLSRRLLFMIGCVTATIMFSFVGITISDRLPIHKISSGTQCGDKGPKILLSPDPDVLGGEFYMRDLRETLMARRGNGTVMIASDMEKVSHAVDLIVLSGRECRKINDVLRSHHNQQVLLISPPFDICEQLNSGVFSEKIHVWLGELSGCKVFNKDVKVRVFSGVDRYIPFWSFLVFELADRRSLSHDTLYDI